MFEGTVRLFVIGLIAALFAVPVSFALAQNANDVGNIQLPGISSYATPKSERSLALGSGGAITLSAQLTDKGTDITRGIVWRALKPEPTSHGKLPEATVEHRAAEMTMKLVREPGGEAIADTSWSLLNESGDPIKEAVGAFASMVLAEGQYTIIAKNRDRIYQKDFTVVAGQNQEIEVLATEAAAMDPEEGAD